MIKCTSCGGDGWYVHPNQHTGEAEQVQCELCRGEGSVQSEAEKSYNYLYKECDDVSRDEFYSSIRTLYDAVLDAEIVIGDYTISARTVSNPENIFIRHNSGEGGEFKKSALHDLIDKFYKENF